MPNGTVSDAQPTTPDPLSVSRDTPPVPPYTDETPTPPHNPPSVAELRELYITGSAELHKRAVEITNTFLTSGRLSEISENLREAARNGQTRFSIILPKCGYPLNAEVASYATEVIRNQFLGLNVRLVAHGTEYYTQIQIPE